MCMCAARIADAGETCVYVSEVWCQLLESDQGCGCSQTVVSATGASEVSASATGVSEGLLPPATSRNSVCP